jgi:hypothetical protein
MDGRTIALFSISPATILIQRSVFAGVIWGWGDRPYPCPGDRNLMQTRCKYRVYMM